MPENGDYGPSLVRCHECGDTLYLGAGGTYCPTCTPPEPIPSTCVVCWQPGPDPLDNGVCADCRRDLSKSVTKLAMENAKLREENERLNDFVVFALGQFHVLDDDEGYRRAREVSGA